MDQSCVPEIQVVGRQEGAGNGNRMEEVKLKIDESPSIFRPRRHGCVAPTRAGTTGDRVIVAAVGPYHGGQSSESPPPLITKAKKRAVVKFLARLEFGLNTTNFIEWARHNDAHARGCYEPEDSLTEMNANKLAEMHLRDGCLVLFAVFLLSIRVDQRPADRDGASITP